MDIIDRKEFRPTHNGSVLIEKPFFDILFDSDTHGPLATFYWGTVGRSKKKFHRDGTKIDAFKGIGCFVKDPSAIGSMSAPAYHEDGYDIGHMVPVEAMMWDRDAMALTWLTSNVLPQRSNLNRGAWSKLERAVFKRQEYGTIGVISGPVFYQEEKRRLDSGIAIPDAFYKIIFNPDNKTVVSYILRNADRVDATLDSHYKTLDEVCAATNVAVPGLVGYINDPGLLDRRPSLIDCSMSMSLQSGFDYPVLENLFNGEYVLNEDYFVNPCDDDKPSELIQIPAGFTTDMGSTPRFIWNIYPPIGTIRDPGFLLHDWMYATHFFEWNDVAYKLVDQDKNRAECDWRLLCMLQTLGDSWGSRNIIYSAVRAGGWSPWKRHTSETIAANRSLLPVK